MENVNIEIKRNAEKPQMEDNSHAWEGKVQLKGNKKLINYKQINSCKSRGPGFGCLWSS